METNLSNFEKRRQWATADQILFTMRNDQYDYDADYDGFNEEEELAKSEWTHHCNMMLDYGGDY